MRKKISGVRNVSIKLEAEGCGVVNWNGTAQYFDVKGYKPDGAPIKGKVISNHRVGKHLGFRAGALTVDPPVIDPIKNPLFVSPNFVRNALFKADSESMHLMNQAVKDDDARTKNQRTFEECLAVLASPIGLLRGYLFTGNSWNRKSPLMVEPLVEVGGQGSFYHQMASGGSKGGQEEGKSDTSLYSQNDYGDTRYVGYASINIEDLQHIQISNELDQESIGCNTLEERQRVASAIAESIERMKGPQHQDLKPKAELGHYCRVNSSFDDTQELVVLNDDALDILVDYIVELFEEFSIQNKGWVAACSVTRDYNTKPFPMGIKKPEHECTTERTEPYARYFERVAEVG